MRPAPTLARAGRFITKGARASTAGSDLTGRHALAQIGLGDPAGCEDIVQIGGRDRVRGQKDRAQAVVAWRRELGRSRDLARVGVLAELNRRVAGGLAEQARVLPDVDGLRAERDAVQGGLVAVLTGYRHLAGEALRGERSDHATGHAIVLRENRIDLVLVLREDLLHVGLRFRRVPVVGVGLADDLDVAGLHGGADDLLHTAPQEVGVSVGLVALDDRVVALRLRREDRLRLELAYENVVDGDVKSLRVLDEPVVGDDRDAGLN